MVSLVEEVHWSWIRGIKAVRGGPALNGSYVRACKSEVYNSNPISVLGINHSKEDIFWYGGFEEDGDDVNEKLALELIWRLG